MRPQTPLIGLGLMVELNLGLEKSGESQGISYCLESGNPVKSILCELSTFNLNMNHDFMLLVLEKFIQHEL